MMPAPARQGFDAKTLEPDNHEGKSDLDLVMAAGYYMEWRTRLQYYISRAKSGDELTRPIFDLDDSAEMDPWLQGRGREKYGHLVSFRHLVFEHELFHKLILAIVASLQKNASSDADALLKNEFSQSTRRILVTIGELNEVIQSEHIDPA